VKYACDVSGDGVVAVVGSGQEYLRWHAIHSLFLPVRPNVAFSRALQRIGCKVRLGSKNNDRVQIQSIE
jgi:hypothetical protein